MLCCWRAPQPSESPESDLASPAGQPAQVRDPPLERKRGTSFVVARCETAENKMSVPQVRMRSSRLIRSRPAVITATCQMTAADSRIDTEHRSRLSSIGKCRSMNATGSMHGFATRGASRWPRRSPALPAGQGAVCDASGAGSATPGAAVTWEVPTPDTVRPLRPRRRGAVHRISPGDDDLSADCRIVGAQRRGHVRRTVDQSGLGSIAADLWRRRQGIVNPRQIVERGPLAPTAWTLQRKFAALGIARREGGNRAKAVTVRCSRRGREKLSPRGRGHAPSSIHPEQENPRPRASARRRPLRAVARRRPADPRWNRVSPHRSTCHGRG